MSELKILRRNELRPRVACVVGTRPSLIKQSAVMRALARRGIEFFVIHAGQHYSYRLDAIFWQDLHIPEPLYHLSSTKQFKLHGAQTAEMLRGIEVALVREKPMAVLVGGDANCNLAGALAARKLQIQVCHEEAGVRSHDWRVPEEHNRRMIDQISDWLFAPNEAAAATLRTEHVMGQVRVTGSPIVDSVNEHLTIARASSRIRRDLALEQDGYMLLTLHHEETVDYRESLLQVVDGIALIAHEFNLPIVFPMHPRTQQRIQHFDLERILAAIPQLRRVEPLGYFDFLSLLADARLVLTESGGVIQEASILRVPCVTLSTYTEWQETVALGSNIVSGMTASGILEAAREMLNRRRDWESPFGDPGPAGRIADVIARDVMASS